MAPHFTEDDFAAGAGGWAAVTPELLVTVATLPEVESRFSRFRSPRSSAAV